MNRTEQYLQLILSRPNQWVRIKKRKAHNVSKASKEREREKIIEEILLALNVMGIKHERLNGTKIRMVTEPVQDFDDRANLLLFSYRYGYQTLGSKTALLNILNDMDDP